jgi:2-polyprenyl-3-methyl-5-hydroxy-6-metoxy-1,4-benzoquinol methylase
VAVLHHPEADVFIVERSDGTRRVRVELRHDQKPAAIRECTTTYDDELIARILEVRRPIGLCDSITQDQDPACVERPLLSFILGYVPVGRFVDCRILDFGCGEGASSLILGRAFPTAWIVGVDLCADRLGLAEARRRFYGAENVRFELSPAPDALPAGIGSFDFVVLNNVLEHLLPSERRALLPWLWALSRPGGVLFIRTPARWYPFERDATGLPLLNYLPDRAALAYARRVSRRVGRRASWPALQRAGVRGSSLREVMRLIGRGCCDKPVVLSPTDARLRGPIGFWLAIPRSRQRSLLRRAARRAVASTAVLPESLQWQISAAILPDLLVAIQRPLR